MFLGSSILIVRYVNLLFGYFYGGFLVSEVYVVFNFDVFVILSVVISMLSFFNGVICKLEFYNVKLILLIILFYWLLLYFFIVLFIIGNL